MINNPDWLKAKIKPYFHQISLEYIEEIAENAKKGQSFLYANKKKDGVKVTASGLQYKVITKSEGAKLTATNKIKVHYRGTLINGKEFDSSYKRNQPAEFGLNQVIKE